jgi:hypothetical protein
LPWPDLWARAIHPKLLERASKGVSMKYIILTLLFSSSLAQAWGGRGHDAICRTAVYLIQEQGLRDYLKNKPQMMGHICNMPDFYWKSLGNEASKHGNPTHFIDFEITGLSFKEISSDFKKIVEDFTGQPNKLKNDGSTIKSVPHEFGSLWWRADQFARRIELLKTDFETSQPPTNRKEEQNDELPYNKLVFEMITNMGLMGHFVADVAQPFHTTADYDGWYVDHGGIHAYFEDGIVSEFDGNLESRMLKEATSLKKAPFLKPPTVIEKMRALSLISMNEIPQILKLDPILKKSKIVRDHGMEIRTDAERKPVKVGFKKMEKIVISDLTRGAVLLANLWDEAYVKAGRPKLAAYKSYKYPFTVNFVMPDYYEIPAEKK